MRANNDWGDECEREKESILPSEIPITLVYQTRPSHTIFLRSDAMATIYYTAHFVRLLFKGGVYSKKFGTSEMVGRRRSSLID